MEGNNIHHTIIRIFTDEANSEDRKAVQQWLNESENNKKLFQDLQEIWLTTGVPNNADHYDVDAAIQQFKAKLSKPTIRLAFGDLLKYAAIILLMITLPFMYYMGGNSSQESTFTTISCAYGDRSEVSLPDGSVVWLNSGSTLSFDSNFKGEFRSVELNGEAYFSVTKDKARPFIVETFGITTEVLGTEFNLTAYEEEQYVSATLVEGSIKIRSASQHALLLPSQKLVYNRSNKKMTRYKLDDTLLDTEWHNGRMVFRDETLANLELKLERWFDVDIEFADEAVKELSFTGVLDRESILETIEYFNLAKSVGYEISGNTITFYSE